MTFEYRIGVKGFMPYYPETELTDQEAKQKLEEYRAKYPEMLKWYEEKINQAIDFNVWENKNDKSE